MHRFHRRAFVAMVSALLAILGQPFRAVMSQTITPTRNLESTRAGRVATLKGQLEAGLKARRQVEFEFIASVVDLVEKEKLSRKFVLETFHYARRKGRYPFQYFQRALVVRAARIGVTISTV